MEESKKTWLFHSPILFRIAVRALGGLGASEDDRADAGSSAMVPVLFAALALEGFANELGDLAADDSYWARDKTVSLFAQIWDTRRATPSKLDLVSIVYCGEPFSKGVELHQDVALLFEVRNALGHLKVDYRKTDPTDKGYGAPPRLIAKLATKGVLVDGSRPEETGWLASFSTRAAGLWACRSVAKMVDIVRKVVENGGPEFHADLVRYLTRPFDVVAKQKDWDKPR